MPVESDIDRAIFFNAEEFGVVATFVSLPGEPEVTGIFDDDAVQIGEVQSSDPTLHCRSIDLPAGAVDGVRLRVAGVEYFLRNPQPDGTGLTVLQLEKVVAA